MAIEDFAGSKPTFDFIRKVDEVFDLLNSRNPFAKGHKAAVSLGNLPAFLKKCDLIAKYLFELQDERGNLLRAGQRKTCIWGLTLSIRSLMAIAIDLLMRSYRPYKYVMTYKFLQDHIELLFNKIQRRCGWNNNPDVLQFKYALR